MIRYQIILSFLLCTFAFTKSAKAQYYSVNFDKETVAKMVASFNTEAATEMYYADQIAKIREHNAFFWSYPVAYGILVP